MTLYVKFDAEGQPAVIYLTPRDGAEAVEDLTAEYLATMRRRPNGAWVKRAKPPAPTAEEREALRLADKVARKEARRAERDAARRERLFDRLVAVAERLDPDFAAEVAKLEEEFKDDEA